MANGQLVCLTGAAGYIGSHIFRELCARGYRVHATVRDASDEGKLAHLRRLAEGAAHPPEYFSADLDRPGAFDEAVAGCDAVINTATVVRLNAPDPQREILDPALRGIQHLLAAVRQSPSVRCLVHTSSIAAIIDPRRPASYLFSEQDWVENVDVRSEPYALSKKLSERACWEFVEELAPRRELRLVTICPSVVFGPVYHRSHLRSSPDFIRNVLRGSYPAWPAIWLNTVDVRDVALAHLRALENPAAQGRYLVNAEGIWYYELARQVKGLYPALKVSTWRMPDPLMVLASLVEKRISFSFIRNYLSKQVRLDSARSRADLGLEYTPLERSIPDTCESMFAVGVPAPGARR